MKDFLGTEVKRLIDMLSSFTNHTMYDAYIEKLKSFETLPFDETKYYLEQVRECLVSNNYNNDSLNEIEAVNRCIELLSSIQTVQANKSEEEIKICQLWKSMVEWVNTELPKLDILKPEYIEYDNWDGGTYYLAIDMSSEYKKAYGLDYNNQFGKEEITFDELKQYLELFYRKFVKIGNRYNYTIIVNDLLFRFRLPYRLVNGKLVKKGYKTTEQHNLPIINYQMLESKILWAEERILCSESLDKHTALNYITDSLQYILSLIKGGENDKKQLSQKCGLLFAGEASYVYTLIKNEVAEIQKIVNEYFDIRHNDYLNAAKNNREPLDNNVIIEYLYNRIYALLYVLRIKYSMINKPNEPSVQGQHISDNDEGLPF